MTKSFQKIGWIVILVWAGALLAACSSAVSGQSGTPTAAQAVQPSNPEATLPPAGGATPSGKTFTIGFSNALTSSDERSQMIADLANVNEEYKNRGLTGDLVVESFDTDLAGQRQQILNLVSKKVDAIIVVPADLTGLNAALQQALDQGILVVSAGVEINLPGVYNIGVDQKARATASLQWLADKMGGKGDFIEISNQPAGIYEDLRQAGIAETLAKYPDLKLVGKVSAAAGPAAAQAALTPLLAQMSGVSGILTGEGQGLGALQGLLASKPARLPYLVGDPDCQYLNLWAEALKSYPDFDSFAIANPPGAAAPTALRFTVYLLQGQKIDPARLSGANGKTFIVPNTLQVTKENFEQQHFLQCVGKPASFILDSIMTDETVQQNFLK